MTMHFADLARQAAADGAITAEEILSLRRAGWADGVMQPDEVEAVFALNDALGEPTAEWSDFFVEAIGEFVINGTEPRGYVSDENARWLMARIEANGALESMTELELLVRVLERSCNVPDPLKAYVLEQIERAVLTGTGPTRRGGALEPGCVSAAEAALLRRVLFAAAGDSPADVSYGEAELLFRLKDATLGAANAPEWKRMFVQGVANYLMGVASRSAQISRERAAELEAEMNDMRSSPLGFARRAVGETPHAFAAIFANKDGERASLWQEFLYEAFGERRDRFAEMWAGEEVTAEEQEWLEAKVGADGKVDEYEQALLDFLLEEAA